jgi:predicted permease
MYTDAYQRAAYYDGLTERVRSVPGVESVGGVWNVPMSNAMINLGVLTEGTELGPDESRPPAEFRIATGNYFETLGIPLISGRTFGPEDVRDAPPRVVISALLAEKLWPGGSAIGRRLSADAFERDGEPNWMEVVGVVGDVRLNGLDDPERGIMYQAYSQRPQARMTLTIRTAGDPLVMTDALRSAILEYEPRTPLPEFGTMEARVHSTVAGRQFFLALLGTFAGIAIVLACVGIYGVLSYSVSHRTREIGVRAALGASGGRILGLVVRQGMSVVVIGVGIGAFGAWGASRVMASMVFGISPTDPTTYAVTGIGVLLAALLACLLPARRAAALDPAAALRSE